MEKTTVTVCGIKKECENCKDGIYNEKHSRIIGCRFGHIKAGRYFNFEKKILKKRKRAKKRFITLLVVLILVITTGFVLNETEILPWETPWQTIEG